MDPLEHQSSSSEIERVSPQAARRILGEEVGNILAALQKTLILRGIDINAKVSSFCLDRAHQCEPGFLSFMAGDCAAEIQDAEARVYIEELRQEIHQLLADCEIGTKIFFSIQHHPHRLALDVSALSPSTAAAIDALRPRLAYTVIEPRDIDTWLQQPNLAFDGCTPIDLLEAGANEILEAYIEDAERRQLESMQFS